MATVLASLERVVARGSAFYNAGQSDLCARLYFQAVRSGGAGARDDGRDRCGRLFGDVLVARAIRSRSASDAPRGSCAAASSSSLALCARRRPTRRCSTLSTRCVPRLTSRAPMVLPCSASARRCASTSCAAPRECDDELDAADAIFFVELDDSSSSDSDDEFEFEIEIDIEVDGDSDNSDELGDGADDADVDVPRPRAALRNDDVSSKPRQAPR
jgi:hypothetical protein